jgi:hypothetical protein
VGASAPCHGGAAQSRAGGCSSGSGEGGEDGAREEEVGGGAGGQVWSAAAQRIAGPRDEGVAAASRD